MNLTGDLRYVSAGEYAAFAGADDDALREAAWQQRLEREPGAERAAFDARYPAAGSHTGRLSQQTGSTGPGCCRGPSSWW